MSDLESKEEKEYRIWCDQHQVLTIKMKLGQGWPDRVMILPNGMHLWIEFKAGTKTPRPLQEYRMRQLRHSGALVGWTNDASTAILCTQALMESTPVSVKGDPLAALTERSWVVSRPWFGEDFNLSCIVKNLEVERLYAESFDNSPPTPDVPGVA